MSSAFQQELDRTSERMELFKCSCPAITGSHRKKDCAPMWHAMSWHNKTVYSVETAEQANAQYPRTCPICNR